MIEIYGAPWCAYCQKAKALVEERELPFVYKDVENAEFKEELKEKIPEHVRPTIPQIWWHGRYVGGYTELVTEIENTIGGYGEGKV